MRLTSAFREQNIAMPEHPVESLSMRSRFRIALPDRPYQVEHKCVHQARAVENKLLPEARAGSSEKRCEAGDE